MHCAALPSAMGDTTPFHCLRYSAESYWERVQTQRRSKFSTGTATLSEIENNTIYREESIQSGSLPLGRRPSTMTLYSSDLATSGLKPYLSIPNIPSIVTEWAALFPLVAHLANHGEESRMIGELALEGHLTVGLFPKLGYLDGLRRLLQGGSDFLDRANANSEATYKVWDVNWGSVFTRANGSAISILTDHALRKERPATQLPDKVILPAAQPPATPSPANVAPPPQLGATMKAVFRRDQKLHIVRMSRTKQKSTMRGTILILFVSRSGEIIYLALLLGLVVVLCLLGAFGSATIVLNGLISKLACRLLRVKRPLGYLENNEHHDACMLSAVHENAQTWYLYIGDRGVIDWLLNKNMLAPPPGGRWQTVYFRIAHILQLLAMTFVAAQKGIDGVCLVVLLAVHYAFSYIFGGHKVSRQWLEAEGVSMNARTYIFSGRTPRIGAIHSLSQARDTAWMDALIVPCPRISVWLDGLRCSADERSHMEISMQKLSSSDRSWVIHNTQLTDQAVRKIREELSQGKATESLYLKSSS